MRPPAFADASRRPNLAVLLALAWLLVVLQLLIPNWARTADTLFDTDDAMRLVELRAFLAGAGWFDLHEARIAPPFGYDPHWSRLIDAGLAGLYLAFRPFTDAATAERLMRTVWPLLWLLPAMSGTMAITARLAGREGALIAVLFTAVGLPAFQQFAPGRIDHHNVQIALTLLAVAATVWSDRLFWSAAAAGFLSALALAIGFECLPFIVACGGAFVLRFIVDGAAGRPLAAYGLSLAGGAAAALLVVVGPNRLSQTACDALAINSALTLVVAGALLALAALLARRPAARFAAAAFAGIGSALVYVALEPRCLGGPFAMVDPALWPVWLAHVDEMQPFPALVRTNPVYAAAIATYPALAILAAIMLAREPRTRRDFAWLVTVAQLLLAGALTLATTRISHYAMSFAIPLMALLALRITASLSVESVAARALIAILFTPAVISAAAITAVRAAGPAPVAAIETAEKKSCFKTENYAPLAALPKGLIAADIDYGPFILALTPHSVLAGPYHRMSAAIIAIHDIFARPSGEARALLARHGATHVAICGSLAPAVGLSGEAPDASLWGHLKAGKVPDWLERLPSTAGQAFAVYRIRPDAR